MMVLRKPHFNVFDLTHTHEILGASQEINKKLPDGYTSLFEVAILYGEYG
jgi:hypothetical protein